MSQILFGLFGLFVLVGLAWLFSSYKKQVDWRLVGTGMVIQVLFAAFVLLTPFGEAIFGTAAHAFVKLSGYTTEGAKMIFGDLATADKFGFIFVFQVLPTVIFFAAISAILYHLGILQLVVKAMAWAITKVMKLSGAETTSVCASVFIGQTEAPLTVRPYIGRMTDSELLTMMIGGMAHIAGGVMATYVAMLGGTDPELQAMYAKHFLAASIMAAPATFLVAKILIPETQEPLTRGSVKVEVEKTSANVIDAAAAGAADGVKLAINIAAMLLAFVALIALINAMIGGASNAVGLTAWLNAGNDPRCVSDAAFAAVAGNGCVQVNLGTILGTVLAPIAWVIGIPWNDAAIAGGLIGQKIVLNEFIAYLQLSQLPVGTGVGAISEESRIILTYALCGFANFASIAIQIGGIGSLAPERRADLARFGLRAVLGGSIATLMTATIAGVMLNWH
ncbi:NupC/NupG family nucleoside CNT transporter [Silanimonas sp.]|jgi:CNT family concentrative nucleoside transporter|uniref:NupC/NupG family nucleoside CNT transporter n=1 Tax=Silanimonas sp. TaxID=1929290 RepID=UPI0037C97691